MADRHRSLTIASAVLAGVVLIGAVVANHAAAAVPRAAAVSAPADALSCGGEVVAKPDGSSWTCTFDDEFDGTALDTNKWLPQLTANSQYTTGPTGSQACYVDRPANIAVGNGVLSLVARKQTVPFSCASGATGSFTTQYTSGMVTTKSKFSQTYGRYEVRARLPQYTAKGLQETLWLYPTNVGRYGSTWPQSGEIDFAEMYSVRPGAVIPYIHYQVDQNASNSATHTNVVTAACPIHFSTFNTYVLDWEPGTLTILVNGSTCLIDNYAAQGLTSPAPFDQNFVIALTQALGVGTNAFNPTKTKLPATTQIDYVRVWS